MCLESNPSNPVPVQPVTSYAGVPSAPKAVSSTPNDVRSLPRLTGSIDVDVADDLSQNRSSQSTDQTIISPINELYDSYHNSNILALLRADTRRLTR